MGWPVPGESSDGAPNGWAETSGGKRTRQVAP